MGVSAITNSTPMIGLACLDQINLLSKLFEKVYVTRQVYDEVAGGAENRIGANQLSKYTRVLSSYTIFLIINLLN